MPKVWVTRSLPGARRSAESLKAMGYEAIAAPLLTIGPPPVRPPNLSKDAALIITSQNALWALITETGARHWPLICVGDVTAALAVEFGFKDVQSAAGTSADIVPLISSLFPNESRPFVHISGQTIRGGLTAKLTAEGYDAARHIYYQSCPVDDLSNLQLSHIDTVLLYSPKAAKNVTGSCAKYIPYEGHFY